MTEEKTPLKWKFTGNAIPSGPAVSEGMVYFGIDDGYLYAVDSKSGTVIWKFNTGGAIISSPVVSGGVVYFGSKDNHLYAVDIKNGKEKWKFITEHWVVSSPAISDDMIFFGHFEFIGNLTFRLLPYRTSVRRLLPHSIFPKLSPES